MNRKRLFCFFLMGIALMMLSSCSSTSLRQVWKDASYNDTIQRVLIIGVDKRDHMRARFENEFIRQFKARGVDAVASYRVLPSKKKLDKDDIRSKVKELNIDTVLVTRLVDIETIKTYIPPSQEVVPTSFTMPYYGENAKFNDLHGYYRETYEVINTPGYTVVDKYVILETNLYDAKTEKIIWNVFSETWLGLGETSSELIKSLVKQLLGNLKKQKML